MVELTTKRRTQKSTTGKSVKSGNFILGDEVEKFENKFAELCGTRYAIGVNSGTDALILSKRSLGIGEGDEVITVPNSFVATASAIALLGAKPVLVDVGDDFNIDPMKIEEKISEKTKASLPVHLTGRPSNLSLLIDKQHLLPDLVEHTNLLILLYFYLYHIQ